MSILIVIVALLLGYANGANDNFKGVATLLGSGTANYRRALAWATLTTALGSVTALFLARGLLQAFTGKGLVPAGIVADPSFPAAVALAAALTVLLATRFGLPISTTHALLGALVGAGLVAAFGGVNGSKLVSGFILPLLTSPLIAILGAALLYIPLRALRRWMGVTEETCVCVGQEIVGVLPGRVSVEHALRIVRLPGVSSGTRATCRVRYGGTVLGLQARPVLDALHYLSAGAVSFARGVNDTPKLAALLLVGEIVSPGIALIGVGAVIAIGGLTAARRVAETMSRDVTEMNPGQGFTANIVTAALVIGASLLALPVSTTHVSCGSLFGIGAVTRQAHWKTIGAILLAWITTLPLAAALAATFYLALHAIR